MQVFTLTGSYLGLFARPVQPTGLVFDDAGNHTSPAIMIPDSSILTFAPDGPGSIFADTGLNGPHGLAFDAAGNLYVVNAKGNTIVEFTPGGVGTIFADGTDGCCIHLIGV